MRRPTMIAARPPPGLPPSSRGSCDRMDTREFPVSPVQARLLLLDQMHPGSAHYNEPVAFAVHGPFDLAAFQASLDALVARHDALRTVFRPGGAGYLQVIAGRATARRAATGYLRVDRDVPVAAVDHLIHAEAARPFDVGGGPLLRCVVYAVADGSHRVQLTVHHLVCDGWSMKLLLDELAAGYRAARQGSPDPPDPDPVPIQYPEYAA